MPPKKFGSLRLLLTLQHRYSSHYRNLSQEPLFVATLPLFVVGPVICRTRACRNLSHFCRYLSQKNVASLPLSVARAFLLQNVQVSIIIFKTGLNNDVCGNEVLRFFSLYIRIPVCCAQSKKRDMCFSRVHKDPPNGLNPAERYFVTFLTEICLLLCY